MSSFYSELMKGVGASTRLWQIIDRQPKIPIDGYTGFIEGIIASIYSELFVIMICLFLMCFTILGNSVPELSILKGDIVFENINFSYPTRPDDEIFKNLTLNVPASSITAVVGASGSGKSTLSALLLRFYDPNGGRILISNHDIKFLNPSWIRENIGLVSQVGKSDWKYFYCWLVTLIQTYEKQSNVYEYNIAILYWCSSAFFPQNPTLFSTTIFENIAYGSADSASVTTEEIIYAAKQANAMQFIDRFPDGLDTVVGERGQSLSGLKFTLLIVWFISNLLFL